MSKPAIAVLRKDLRATRLFWAPTAFSYFAFLLMFMENVWLYLAAGTCLAFVATAVVLAIDDYYRTDPLFAGLPGTRRTLVAGRYLAWGVFTVVGLGCFLAFTAIVDAGLGDRFPGLVTLLSLKGVATFLAATGVAGALFLPFYFRLGFWRAIWTFSVAGLAAVVAGLNFLGGLAPGGAATVPQSPVLPGAFAPTIRGLRWLAGFIDRDLGRPEVAAAGALVLTALVFLSYRLSVRSYEKRDL